jgi:hypothetical protein
VCVCGGGGGGVLIDVSVDFSLYMEPHWHNTLGTSPYGDILLTNPASSLG